MTRINRVTAHQAPPPGVRRLVIPPRKAQIEPVDEQRGPQESPRAEARRRAILLAKQGRKP